MCAQTNSEYPELNNYSRFGFSVGGVLFNEAKLSDLYGPYTVQTKPIPSFSFGITYNLPLHRKWSIETGLFFVNEPSLYVDCVLFRKDLPEVFTSNVYENIRLYLMYSPSIPLSVKYNLKISKNSYLHYQVGIKTMLIFSSSSLWTVSMLQDSLIYNVFGIYCESPDPVFHGSFFTGVGYSIALKHILLRVNLTYTSNFQNTNEGFLKFLNLRESADSGGNYILSGDHFAFTITANFKKFKKRLEQQKLKM